MNVVLIGPPGAGKGTQADFLVEKLNLTHLSTGDILRRHVRDETELGKKAKEYMDAGKLVPDQLVIDMMNAKLDELKRNGAAWLLDGYPRSVDQAEALTARAGAGDGVDKVIYLDVSDDEVVRRLSGRRTCPSCGKVYHIAFNPPKREGKCDVDGVDLIIRDDDKEETIRARLATYHDQTAAVVTFFRNAGKLVQIAGEAAPPEVTQRIAEALNL